MTRVTSNNMSITINGTEYSTFIDTFEVTGGTPMFEYISVWNGRKKRAVTGYNEWKITITLLVDTNTETFIDTLTDITETYEIIIGEAGVIEKTYSNLFIEDFSENMDAGDGLHMMDIMFIGEGLPDNKN